MAEVADQALHVSGPCVDEDIDSGPVRENQMDASRGHDDRTDGAQTSSGLRIEALEGLREPAIALVLDRAHEVLGALRIGPLDLLDRAIKVPEDPPHLFFNQAEGGGSEGVNRRLGLFPESFRRQTVSSRHGIAEDRNIGCRDEFGFLRGGIHFPCGSRRRRDDDPMEVLTLLVGHERHSEGELEQDGWLDVLHLPTDPGLRAQAALRQRVRNPIARGGLEPRDVPSTPADGEGHDLLEKVAPGSEEFRLELPDAIRVQGHRGRRRDLELGP
jgi:hypothetical protein